MPKYRSVRRCKRRFSGNQYKKTGEMDNEETCNLDNASNGDDSDQPTTSKSASFRKLFSDSGFFEQEATKATTSEEEKVPITGFRFCDMEILSSAFSSTRCADCGHFNVVLMENHLKRSGCASRPFLCELWLDTRVLFLQGTRSKF